MNIDHVPLMTLDPRALRACLAAIGTVLLLVGPGIAWKALGACVVLVAWQWDGRK